MSLEDLEAQICLRLQTWDSLFFFPYVFLLQFKHHNKIAGKALLYFTGEQATFSSLPTKIRIVRGEGMFSCPWMEASKFCWDGKRLAGPRVPSPAVGLQGQLQSLPVDAAFPAAAFQTVRQAWPQQIPGNPSSCRRSGRRRSVISLEPGGQGPQPQRGPSSTAAVCFDTWLWQIA